MATSKRKDFTQTALDVVRRATGEAQPPPKLLPAKDKAKQPSTRQKSAQGTEAKTSVP